MKTTLCLFVLLSILPLTAHADENRRDGNWWIDQPAIAKPFYIVGFLDGMYLGRNFSYWNIVGDKGEDACIDKIMISYRDNVKQYLTHITSGQLSEALDVFYKDYRNRRITADDAIWIVLNEIAGTPRPQLDKTIENFRKNASQ